MKKLVYIFLIISMFNNSAKAKIITSSNAKDIAYYAQDFSSNDLITFDVKGVLFWPEDKILQKDHRSYYKNAIKHIQQEQGIEQAQKLDSIVLLQGKQVLVDSELPSIIKSLQKRGIKVVALTSGHTGKYGMVEAREDLRVKQLKALGIDFSTSFPAVSVIKTKDEQNNDKILFKKGVIFAERSLKSDSLLGFLRYIKFHPGKLLHIDDNYKNLRDLEIFCTANKIEFTGIYFRKNRADTLFDRDVANYQLKTLKEQRKWLNDKEAKAEATNQPNKIYKMPDFVAQKINHDGTALDKMEAFCYDNASGPSGSSDVCIKQIDKGKKHDARAIRRGIEERKNRERQKFIEQGNGSDESGFSSYGGASFSVPMTYKFPKSVPSK